jgi:hypothetical protein
MNNCSDSGTLNIFSHNKSSVFNKGLIMSQQVNMNVFLHSLLITNKMNDFTVAEARDSLLTEHAEFTDELESRKFIYRQLTRNIEKGLIKRSDCFEGGTKKVLYSKTDKFFASKIVPISRRSKMRSSITKSTANKPVAIDYKAELKKELTVYEIDLNTILEEAEEYKRLSIRFPELQKRLKQHQSQAKDKSIQLLGKIHALQNLLGYSVTEDQSC